MKAILSLFAVVLFAAATAQPVDAAPKGKKKVLVQCTAGSDDPTRATLCLVAAFGIAEAGHKPTLVLLGESAYLMNPAVADATVGVGLGKASDWFVKLKKHKVPVFVWVACAKAREVSEKQLQAHDAKLITAKDYGNMVVDADRTVAF